MLISFILWIIFGSALLWLMFINLVGFAWVFAFVKKQIWPQAKQSKFPPKDVGENN